MHLKTIGYGIAALFLLFFVYWLTIFMKNKDEAARMIGMDCWENCDSDSQDTYVKGKLVSK
tara:strand:- start:634 stop:816 length:183 start_codon:yes stop_codon:yes gene_type:complete